MEAKTQTETGDVTGTKDKDYNLIWFVEQCLSNVLSLVIYIHDADRDGDSDLADFFRRAQAESRNGAEQRQEKLRVPPATCPSQADEMAKDHGASVKNDKQYDGLR